MNEYISHQMWHRLRWSYKTQNYCSLGLATKYEVEQINCDFLT